MSNSALSEEDFNRHQFFSTISNIRKDETDANETNLWSIFW